MKRKNKKVPLRVDFAGGWLDVPKFATRGGYIVNCAISPLVSDNDWPYEICSGLGGSGAKAVLDNVSGVESELKLGVGWQDPAIIQETGVCVWKSAKRPILEIKSNPGFLKGKMVIVWTGKTHNTPGLVNRKRDFEKIKKAGGVARDAVYERCLNKLFEAINLSYEVQLGEKMEKLEEIKTFHAKKYLGGGHGGYALYIFKNKKDKESGIKEIKRKKLKFKEIEPYIKPVI